MLDLIITFSEEKDDPSTRWNGYIYCLVVFGSAVVQSLSLHQYFHIMMTIGMNLRACIIGMVYPKVKIMARTDHRLKLINEMLNGIKVLKLYAWENSLQQKVMETRNSEIRLQRKALYINASFLFIYTCAPFLARVSIGRLEDFLSLEEVNPNDVIKSMPVHCNINLNIPTGSLVAVVGQVGCGKSTLLSALLGETEKVKGTVYVQGSVAYVPQQAWIQNATLRDNIVFSRTFDRKRLKKTIENCALQPDLLLLPAGEMTEIGEKGINLSGGQKQRVNLARAVYFNADVYLLDDPLSAVDSRVGKHIFDKVIGPRGVLQSKTRILVTHAVHFLPEVDQIIVLQGGRISEVGTYDELQANQGAFAEFLKTYANRKQDEEEEGDVIKDSSNQLLIVKLSVYLNYGKAMGIVIFFVFVFFMFAAQGSLVASNIWLAHWSSINVTADKERDFYLGIYGGFGFFQSFFTLISSLILTCGAYVASRLLHDNLLVNILRSPMSYFESTPLGRIVNRFSKDMFVIDDTMPKSLDMFWKCFFEVVSSIFVICYATPFFLIVVVPLAALYFFIQRIYVATSRQLRRIESVSRSPIYSNFLETINGTSTIRAYSQQQHFIRGNHIRIDENQVAYYPWISSNRWLAVRLEFIGNLVILFATLLVVIKRGSIESGLVGLSLTQAFKITQTLNWTVRTSSELETNIVAVERVKEYSETPTEAEWIIDDNRPPDDWPGSGNIVIDSFDLKYRENLPLVLKNINCKIESGEKIGIVGRTGAGKSSLSLALFRILESSGGKIVVDGIDISKIGLHDLRSRLTIIPQDPVLFSGTLRFNLDPFDKYSDEQLWSVLEVSHLKQFVSGLGEGLQHAISEGGENLSETDLKYGAVVSASMIAGDVDLKFFPSAPTDKDLIRKPCPEDSANIFSKLTFWWLNWLIYTGFKRPLEDKDMWALRQENRCSTIIPKLDAKWQHAVETCRQKHPKPSVSNGDANAELPGVEDINAKIFKNGNQETVEFVPKKTQGNRKYQGPSLAKVLFFMYWKQFLLAACLKLVHDGCVFIQPQMLDLIITFSEEKDDPSTRWNGYIYCLALRLNNKARNQSTAGEMVNLLTTDAQRIMDLLSYVNTIWSGPLQIIVALYLLYNTMGVSILAGVGVMILLIPINICFSKVLTKLQVKIMSRTDNRLKLVNEMLNAIKVLKLYAWENSLHQKVMETRNSEIRLQRKALYVSASFQFTFTFAPFLVSLATFAIYVLTGNMLTANKAFVAISLFQILSFPLVMFPRILVSIIQARVSIGRLEDFLSLEEVNPNDVIKSMPEHCKYGILHADQFCPLIMEYTIIQLLLFTISSINLNIPTGSLVAVVGQVGCGKSTLLSALLGEAEKVKGTVYVKGSVAYVPQQAWIQNATLRDNIVFSRTFDRKRFKKTIENCALKTDLLLLPAGEMTEIGEKGINLSGGQKQRVNLARAVYFNADVYLLDDPLSAVDSRVGKHIFDKVIGPRGVLQSKTRILVTHAVHLLPEVDQIVVLQGGRISEVGTYDELQANQGAFAEFLKTYANRKLEEEGEVEGHADCARSIDSHGSSRFDVAKRLSYTSISSNYSDDLEIQKVIEDETSEVGRVKLSVYLNYGKAMGIVIFFVFIFFIFVAEGSLVASKIWLAHWSSINVTADKERDFYLGIYGGFGFFQSFFSLISSLILAYGAYVASRLLHDNLLVNILRSPMSYFESTPLGRIVNRFSKDMFVIDDTIPRTLSTFWRCLFEVVSSIFVISYATPFFLIVVVPLAALYVFIQRIYVATSRQLRRIESVSRSPIYSNFLETINGTSTIRAYSQQQHFIRGNHIRIDENQVAYYPWISSNRWLAVRLEFIGNLVTLFATLFVVIKRGSIESGLVGLSLTQAFKITQILNWTVRMSSELETNIVAVERVKEYSETPTEAEWIIDDNRPPDDWPRSGNIVIDSFDLKYRENLPLVLKNINCKIESGEKIGIVGRTGAGKSSLSLALFRILESSGGKIVVDGIDISKIGLHDLRSRLTIIPQDPVLFSGTLRFNLDPFDKYSDEQLWSVLEVSHLKQFVSGLGEGLQHAISEGGENL
ncbi:hypothetical protein QZH41_010856, partial [Actinostola sp. cb2023]